MNYKVAVCQESIIPGGRFRVVLGMIEILNEFGIDPDILTFRLNLKQDQIAKIYGRLPRFKFRTLPHFLLPNDFSIVVFNVMLKYFASDYDLIINTSNSMLFLPKEKKVLSYIFYPRESRIKVDLYSIHDPEKVIHPYSPEFFSRKLLRKIYSYRNLHSSHHIVAMTEFTRTALESDYPLSSSDLPVIYPPVEIGNFEQKYTLERKKDIVTIGRFAPDKRQLDQIRLAAQLPNINFHIVGFVGNKKYYKRCEQLVEELKLSNVHLHPNASHSFMADILYQCRYFIHTLINEPFGITAVQAIAAGCLPIVHDSGGQREVVPYSQLRYKKLEDISRLIENLESQSEESLNDLHKELYRHVSGNYNETIFHEKMKAILYQNLTD